MKMVEYLYGLVALAASALLMVIIAARLVDPLVFEKRLQFMWVNDFFHHPQYYPEYFLFVGCCSIMCLVALLPGFCRKLLDRPIVFALFFSSLFFIIGFERDAGDAHDWIDWISGRYFMSEPGSTLIHHIFYKLLHKPFNLGAASVISFTSRLAGFASLVIVARISNILFQKEFSRMLFRLFFYFSGVTLLFFGYIENTPLSVPFELLYLLFMVKWSLHNRDRYIYYAALFLSIASIIHGSVSFVFSSLIICLLVRYHSNFKNLLKVGGITSATYLLTIALFVAWVFIMDRRGLVGGTFGNIMGGGDNKMFVPLFKRSEWANYTFFSRRHFDDMFNLIFVGASCHVFVALLFIPMIVTSIKRGINAILFAYLVSRLALLFLWNCDWGFLLDWDLMIANVLPIVFISGYYLSRDTDSLVPRLAGISVLMAGVLVTVMFFFVFNGRPTTLAFFPSMRPIQGAEENCLLEGLVTRYYSDKKLTKLVKESATDFPDHFYGLGGPIKEIPGPPFGIVWTGYLKIKNGGRHRFRFIVEDNYRLYLNDELIDERWTGGGTYRADKEIYLYPGLYRFRMDFFNNEKYGTVLSSWENACFERKKLTPGDFCHSPDDEMNFND